jgi:hypothetical protein
MGQTGYPGYGESSESLWWWKVAQHLDEANGALVNAQVHNLDDQTMMLALQDKLREAQVILLAIFEMNGIVAVSVRAPVQVASSEPLLGMSEPAPEGAPDPEVVSPVVPPVDLHG